MKEYLQYISKFIWSSVKPSARKWFWVIVVAAVLSFLVLFGILRYKMEFSVTDSGYIGWLFTARAVIIALISTALIILTVLVTVGTAIYRRVYQRQNSKPSPINMSLISPANWRKY